MYICTMKDKLQKSEHQIERIKERFEVFNSNDLPFSVKNHIKRNISLLEKVKLPFNKSFAIMLGTFIPNIKSKHHVSVMDNRSYYSIIDDTVISDSTGDQFWVIVRYNKVTTFMLRKSIQTTNLEHNLEKLRVDEVITNLSTFIKEIQV